MTESEARSSIERLEAAVCANRFTIAVFFPVVGAGLMLASGRYDQPLLDAAVGSAVGILVANGVMALPLAVAVLPALDRRAVAGLAFVSCFAYLVEVVGVATGLPYGDFEYQVELGPMALGVPVALPLFWVPMLLNGLLLSVYFVRPRTGSRVVVGASAVGFVVVLDALLDPGAVALGFWSWEEPGVYYGVPLVNYLGWLFSASVGVILLYLGFDVSELRRRAEEFEPAFDTLVAFLVFWGLVAAFHGLLLPLGVAAGLLALLLSAEKGRYLGTHARGGQ